ncbi:MAG: hypothetical protein JNJ83_17775 [Verrucomicrobiaceae bacterium]|nr:hypothetical protein [Verrucomicrobiaceae bacterium]
MRFLKRVFWILAFAVVTFFWAVAFQHGFSLQAISSGAREEVKSLLQMISGGTKS